MISHENQTTTRKHTLTNDKITANSNTNQKGYSNNQTTIKQQKRHMNNQQNKTTTNKNRGGNNKLRTPPKENNNTLKITKQQHEIRQTNITNTTIKRTQTDKQQARH